MALTGEDAVLLACFRFLFRGHELVGFQRGEEAIGLEAASSVEEADEGASEGEAG